MSKEHIISDMIPLFKTLAGDDQDSVRLLTVEDMIAISESLSHDECKAHLLDTLKTLCNDKSWRVRYMIAEKFVQVRKREFRRANEQQKVMVFNNRANSS